MVERTILKELGFSFYVIEHAHRFILFYVKLLDGDAELAQEAWASVESTSASGVLARSSGSERAPPPYRAGVASMAWNPP